MARQDTVVGLYNYPLTPSQYTLTTLSPILTPAASGVDPQFPSPVFPLSTTTTPCAIYLSVPPELNTAASNAVTGATSVFDGHPFEVSATIKVTAPSGNTSMLVGLYNATNAVLSGGPGASAYSVVAALSGTGVTALNVGTSTAIGASTSTNFTLKSQFIWDSVGKALNIFGPAAYQWQKGVTVSVTSSFTTLGSLSIADLNFILGITFATTLPTSCTVTEFVINRL